MKIISIINLITMVCCFAGRPAKPNVILLLSDDLGWQDVKCYDIDAPSPMETPNIDKLAKKGIQFWQGYSPAPSCAPSRAAILSGIHPARAQQTHVSGGTPPAPYHKTQHRMMPPWYRASMPIETYSLAEALRDNGYATGHSGKWHLSKVYGGYPQAQDHGFDWSRNNHGILTAMKPHRLTGFASNQASDPYRLDENGFCTHQNSEDALTFVRENKDKAFFLYYATFLVHTPVQTRCERLLKKYCEKLGVELPKNPKEWKGEGQTNPFYCAMVEELDYYVGKLFDYLETTEDPRWPGHMLSENTYIIFTSDNGGMEKIPGEIITDNYPLHRGKISAMEGGVRVPLIITGPGIKPKQQSDVMINGLDFYPTILSWTGTQMPDGKTLDGCDISTLLAKNPSDPALVRVQDGSVRDTMIWHFPNSVALESTIRIGGYKLIRNYDHLNNKHAPELELYQLYETHKGKQLRSDIEESKNLVKLMPEKAQSMNQKLTGMLTGMKASYPYYNPHHKKTLPGKESVPKVMSHTLDDSVVECIYQENGAKVMDAHLLYTLNGGERSEEWFRVPATLAPSMKLKAKLPKGTTHYVINLIDENNFLVSYPDINKPTNSKPASLQALRAHSQKAKKPLQQR